MADELESEPHSPTTSPSPNAAAKTTWRVVDFELDDDEWEDKDTQLGGLGTTMHRSRNHAVPVIPVRKHHRVVGGGANVRATAGKRQGERSKKMTDLAADLDA